MTEVSFQPLKLLFRPELAPPDAEYNYSKSPSKPARFVSYLRETPLWQHVAVTADFAPVTRQQLLLAHQPAYVDAFLTGQRPDCESSGLAWSPAFRNSVLWTNGCMLAAIEAAVAHPTQVTMAPVSGFHHARPASGSGFCTFSGQVVAALHLYRTQGLRGVWFDLDGHFGNSIEDSRAWAPDLNEAIASHCNVNPIGAHGNYLASLDRHIAQIRQDLLDGSVDYVCFAHGADSHEWDQLGHQCTTEEWLEASRRIYHMLREVRAVRPVPVTLALFGGYRDDHPKAVLGLHAMDLAQCLHLLGGLDVSFRVDVPPRR
jgi:acetoin utilization deacetylase AcuC-like enzyme